MLVAVDKPDQSGRLYSDVAQNSWFISEGNGGESRKSFHGYPKGYAQLIESPTSWHITPMQIDTRNREHGVGPESVHNCTNMTECAGYEPRQARYGRGWGGVAGQNKHVNHYSGILECPCNSRHGGDPEFYPDSGTKVLTHAYTAIPSGTCKEGESFSGAKACFDAVASLGFDAASIKNTTAADPKTPSGCVFLKKEDGSAEAVYNQPSSSLASGCPAASTKVAGGVSPTTKMKLGLSLSKMATITLSGPADKWFAVGMNAELMSEQPYTLVVNSTGVSERKIGTCGTEADHCPGTLLAPSIKLVSHSVEDGIRTVVVTRPLKGLTKDHYSFEPGSVATLKYITAVGSSETFGYHAAHDSSTLSFSNPSGPTCVCDLGVTGQLCDTNATHCKKFTKNCVAHSPTLGAKGEDSGDLLSQRNPTCNSKQYVGGLTCCSHGRIMLDDDQTQQDQGALLRYHMKFRFWYQDYTPAVKGKSNASHFDLPRIYWQTEGDAGEYDIPPAFYTEDQPKIAGYPDLGPYPELSPGSTCTGDCPHGDDCECIHTITYNKTVSNMRLIYAGGHCHAPSCIGMWLYRNDHGPDATVEQMELLCYMRPMYGNGTGTNSVSGIYDEAGYLSLPPCLWGDEPGLHPSVLLPPNTELVSIKKNRNTHVGHYGEMASWQMRGVNF